MKRLAPAIVVVLFFISFTFVTPNAAVDDGPSASGTFEVSADGGPTRSIEFSVRLAGDGTTTGEVIFHDVASGAASGNARNDDSATKPFSLKAELDCLVIKGNKAVMSGTVSESSIEKYIGSRLLLAAHDNNNETNRSGKDRLTWGIYRSITKDWLPKDSERSDEQDIAIAWIAKDAERPEDEGVFTDKSEPLVGCRTFPFSSFSFVDPKHGHGNIQVRP